MRQACFLFPHPDDEFAVTVLIRDRCRSGVRVSCVYLTDGAFAGQSPVPRRRETLAALAGLGVNADDVLFLGEAEGISDGSLPMHLERALQALCCLEQLQSGDVELFCPAWEGGHQDHDAAHLIGLALDARLRFARARQYSIYHGASLPGPLFRVLSPLAENGASEDRSCSARERVQQVLFCLNYPSQWKTFLGLLPCVAWRMLCDGRMRTQALDATRALQSPHRGRPLYERRGFMSERDFRLAVAGFIVRRIPAAHGVESAPTDALRA